MADNTDADGKATIELLETRLRHIEHILYGPTTAEAIRNSGSDDAASMLPATSTVDALAVLERRFASLVSGVRVYGELLRIYHTYSDLFSSVPAAQPPTQLDADALRATVLSYATTFPATASALSAATVDMPVPDPALSAQLIVLMPRMQMIAAHQNALDTAIAQLRHRSEALVRQYYEQRALASAEFVAGLEARLTRAEGAVRRQEKALQAKE